MDSGLRGVAATMVVLFHIDAAARLIDPAWPITAGFKYFAYGGVNLFFVISGFVMIYISYEDWGQPRKWVNFVARRVVRVYPTYWAVYAATVLIFYAGMWFYGVVPKSPCFNGDLVRVIGSIILIRDVSDMCYVPQAWTLHWEIWFYLIFSLVFLLSRKYALLFGAAWASLSVVIVLFGRAYVTDWTFIWSVFNLHFLAGAAICLFYPRLKNQWSVTAILFGAGWFLASGYLNSIGWMDTENVVHRLIQFVPASVLITYGALGLEMRSIHPPRWLLLLGNASYSIYLTHYPFDDIPRISATHGWNIA